MLPWQQDLILYVKCARQELWRPVIQLPLQCEILWSYIQYSSNVPRTNVRREIHETSQHCMHGHVYWWHSQTLFILITDGRAQFSCFPLAASHENWQNIVQWNTSIQFIIAHKPTRNSNEGLGAALQVRRRACVVSGYIQR